MAQDTHLFSVSKPRQTLGALHNNHSAIPQPSSALKRSSSISGYRGHNLDAPATVQHTRNQASRMSMMPSRPPPQPNFTSRMSLGPMANDVGQGMRGGRMSMAPPSSNPMTTPHHKQATMSLSAQRTSNVYTNRQSTGPAGPNHQQQSFFVQAPLPPGVPHDPRRLRDRQQQVQMISELENYVAENNFTMDMKHTLQPNAFRQPTQKDFNMIFQWLYKRIDPAYVFQKSMDNEIPALLQQLRYPFSKSITKSQLGAVGGQNWHVLLGMLHWLMQLAQMMDGFVSAQYDDALQEEGIDVSADRIMAAFLRRAYHTWSSCPADMPDEEVQELLDQEVGYMAKEFEDNRAAYTAGLEILEAENAALLKQIEEEEAAMPDLQRLDEDKKLLEVDVSKFEAYAKRMTEKLNKTEERIRISQEEIEKSQAQIEEKVQEKASLQEAVDRQGITIQQIDQMNSERDRLQDSTDDVKSRLEEVGIKLKEMERATGNKLAQLEELQREYNSLRYSVNMRDEESELVLQVNDGDDGEDRLLADGENGYHPLRIVNLDMRGTVKKHIIKLRREVDERRADVRIKDDNNKHLLVEIATALDDKRHDIESLRHHEGKAEEEFNDTKETTTKQKCDSEAEIEKIEAELARLRSNGEDNIQLWQQRELNAKLEYEQLEQAAETLRERLHTESAAMMDFIVKFKLHIQEDLEQYEEFVGEEAEKELVFQEELDKRAGHDLKVPVDLMEVEKVEYEDEEEEL